MHLNRYPSNTISESTYRSETSIKSSVREFWELTKPRLSFLSVITAIVGYLTANPTRNHATLIALILGTSLAAGGAATLNQYLEREFDSRMARTRSRPIPAGLITPFSALIYGLLLSLSGVVFLLIGTNLLTTGLCLLTILSYLLIYTPLKQKTPWCTQIGAIPGALPPLIGWAAAHNGLAALGWVLFGILFAWQIPHFMAIAWMYQKDYQEAHFPIATVTDPTGKSAANQSLIYTILLALLSFLPFILGETTRFYAAISILTSFYILLKAIQFSFASNRNLSSRKLFFASIFYLPVLLAALVIDRWLFL